MSMKITTNNQPREIIEGYELIGDERKDFDYLDWNAIEKGEDSASFFRYKGELYDLGEFTTTSHMVPLHEWDGYQSETYFSGIVVKYSGPECEEVIIGRYCT